MGSNASRITQISKGVASRYGLAVLLAVLALLVRWLLDPVLGARLPYIVLLPVVALLSLYEGTGPAGAAGILGLIGVLYWYEPSRGGRMSSEPRAALVSAAVYAGACALIITGGELARRTRARLDRAKILFETFLDNSPSVCFLKDLDGRYVYLNKVARQRHGQDFTGKTDLDIVDAATAELWRANDEIVLREGVAHQFIETTEEADGEHTWFTVLFPVTDADGRRLLGGKVSDITAQRRAEEEVRRLQQESARRAEEELEGIKRLLEVAARCLRAGNEFHECLEGILDAAIELTGADKGNLRLLDAQSGALTIVVQRGFEDPFLAFFASGHSEASACGVAAGSKDRVVIENVASSELFAGTRSLEILLNAGVRAVQSTPLVSSSGSILGIVSTHYAETHQLTERELRLMDLLARQAADYLERKKSEEALATVSDQLRRFMGAAPTGLTHCSRDLRYVEVNPAYAQMAGLPPEQIVGRKILEVMGPKGWAAIRPYVEEVLRGERVQYEMVLPFAASGPHHVHVVYTPEIDGAGEVVGWFASVADTTQLKQAEEKLQQIERMAAAGRLAASLAHEINNPLMSVTNLLYMIEHQTGIDSETTALIRTAGAEIARVSRIVKQSLSYYRTSASAVEVDLAALVEESLQIFKERMQKGRIEIRKKLSPGTLVLGYPDEIRQVIDNLLLNAQEAMEGGGRLTVSVRHSRSWKDRRGRSVRMTIADSGAGIPSEHLPLIFEPFFTTKMEKGTGLGLWVVNGIISKHDGSVKIRSSASAGQSGTVISILWPSAGREWDLLRGPPRRSTDVEEPTKEPALADSTRAGR
ncbi:MAG: PAS domain-containing protein [Acidobacteriaceae bacterium]|nr:PAS domain-containing protein [Acidobacteriaceae bacterium]